MNINYWLILILTDPKTVDKEVAQASVATMEPQVLVTNVK